MNVRKNSLGSTIMPAGGVGINITTHNIDAAPKTLADPMLTVGLASAHMRLAEQRRERQTSVTRRMQKIIQFRVIIRAPSVTKRVSLLLPRPVSRIRFPEKFQNNFSFPP